MIVYVVVEDWHDLGEWTTEPICVCRTLDEAKKVREEVVKNETDNEPGWEKIQDDDHELSMQFRHNGEEIERISLYIYQVPMKDH